MSDVPNHAFDGALVTGAVSTPFWISLLSPYAQAMLIVIAIVLGVLRIAIAWRDLADRRALKKRIRTPLSEDEV